MSFVSHIESLMNEDRPLYQGLLYEASCVLYSEKNHLVEIIYHDGRDNLP